MLHFGMNEMHRVLGAILAALLAVAAASGPSWAGGSQAYTNGSEDFEVGMLPPPSLHYIHYANFYRATDFKDNGGNDVGSPKTTTFANTLRLLWITPWKIFGGQYATHVFLPVVYTDTNNDPPSGRSRESKFGLGNIIFTPFLVGWHWENFHAWVNIADIFAPTSTGYDRDDTVNLGNDFWTIEPIVAFSYLPPAPEFTGLSGRFEVTAKIMYDISTKDRNHVVTSDEAQQLGRPEIAGERRTRRPGQEFHFDYVLGYRPSPSLTMGAVGYFYQQTTDDKISGDTVKRRKGRVFAVGPGFKYTFKEQKLSLVGKMYFETLAKNRNEGISSFIKLFYEF